MRTALAVAAWLALAPLAASAADGDFGALVKGIESRYGVRRTHIPLWGVAKFFVRVARPEGVKRFDMAVFEDAKALPPGEEFDELVRGTVGEGWTPVIRVRERNGDEQTYLYARPAGHDVAMVMATFDAQDTVVMKFQVDPARFQRMLDEPGKIRKTD